MNRKVAPEWLDELAPAHAHARGSRRDLQRLNWWMRNASILSAVLAPLHDSVAPVRLLEIGAGDGHLLLQVARHLGGRWRGTRATLLDRHPLVSNEALLSFGFLGWQAEVLTTDVFAWSGQPRAESPGIVMANLFLHHFDSPSLTRLLDHVAQSTKIFVALEPRRSLLSLIFSRLVGLLGCNAVTRHDAPVSVKAGFNATDLSRAWPRREGWLLHESRAGVFGHLFVARAASSNSTW